MSEWNHVPDLPLTVNPLFRRPFQPKEVMAWYVGAWLPLTVNGAIVALSVGIWLWFSPTLAEATGPGLWMLEVLLRNAVLLILVAGGLHWWFHGAKMQGQAKKYDPRPYPRQGRMFTGGSQLRDNVTWALGSGVPIWSFFECLIWLGMGQGWVNHMSVADHPVWFFAFFLLLPI